ncbi:hypothetical protein ABH15_11540 [Methanoculleus taiwanensis]|uniref:Uncharacterized protein n=1 Tax=Methanoculleus taiwanensis TaxID=1550565 RepID=A0A498GZ53_9EURY|nr:hypothetical protein [Methanoculleus taiwanensis]RXE55375.1 hypothetical protein ABH15_11540 [Methanoculleus taiwanensis]
MKFVSNIGWIHKRPTELQIDILNVENLVIVIPLDSVRAVIAGSSLEESIFNNRREEIGTMYLSSNGGALYLDVYCGEEVTSYSTPIRLVKAVIDNSAQKPISQIIEERDSTNNMPRHDYYSALCRYLSISGSSIDIRSQLEVYRKAAIKLISGYREGNLSNINYDDLDIQTAYMLCYFPSYIENVFQTLSFVDLEQLRDVFEGHLMVSLYGCGPAPDFLGLLAYINRHFRGEVSTIDPYFFERGGWEKWRDFCIGELAQNYCDGISINPHHCSFNLLECDRVEYLKSFNPVMDSNLHIFQNCATELFQATRRVDSVLAIFLNFIEVMKPGSIILINDFIGKGDSFKILLKLKKKLLEMNDIVLLDVKYNADEYSPEVIRHPEVNSVIDGWYREARKEPRKRVGFSYCIAKKC